MHSPGPSSAAANETWRFPVSSAPTSDTNTRTRFYKRAMANDASIGEPNANAVSYRLMNTGSTPFTAIACSRRLTAPTTFEPVALEGRRVMSVDAIRCSTTSGNLADPGLRCGVA